jgi:hypothetical protein
MSEIPAVVIPRHESHGDAMDLGSQNNDRKTETTLPVGAMGAVHCHDCWKYTDDVRREVDLAHEAAAIVINGGTLTVENSEAFKAADAFLASKFRAMTPLGAPRFGS